MPSRMETHQHYISCYAPPMLKQKEMGMWKLNKMFKDAKIVNPTAKSIRCIIDETIPHQRWFPSAASSVEIMVHKALWKSWYTRHGRDRNREDDHK